MSLPDVFAIGLSFNNSDRIAALHTQLSWTVWPIAQKGMPAIQGDWMIERSQLGALCLPPLPNARLEQQPISGGLKVKFWQIC